MAEDGRDRVLSLSQIEDLSNLFDFPSPSHGSSFGGVAPVTLKYEENNEDANDSTAGTTAKRRRRPSAEIDISAFSDFSLSPSMSPSAVHRTDAKKPRRTISIATLPNDSTVVEDPIALSPLLLAASSEEGKRRERSSTRKAASSERTSVDRGDVQTVPSCAGGGNCRPILPHSSDTTTMLSTFAQRQRRARLLVPKRKQKQKESQRDRKRSRERQRRLMISQKFEELGALVTASTLHTDEDMDVLQFNAGKSHNKLGTLVRAMALIKSLQRENGTLKAEIVRLRGSA